MISSIVSQSGDSQSPHLQKQLKTLSAFCVSKKRGGNKAYPHAIFIHGLKVAPLDY
jgi:hypothetical protein